MAIYHITRNLVICNHSIMINATFRIIKRIKESYVIGSFVRGGCVGNQSLRS